MPALRLSSVQLGGTRDRPSAALWSAVLIGALLGISACGRKASEPVSRTWIVAGEEPVFDPDGPPDPVRWALERLLTRSLVEEDTSGTIVPAAAERVDRSADSLTYTFHLRPGLAFSDGTPCGSAAFRAALVGGLARTDHSTRAWLLAAVQGVDAVRPGKPLPPLGIETPDDSTLVLRLTRPDPMLLEKLAVPGVCDAWSNRAAGNWSAHGIGGYRVVRGEADKDFRLVRVRQRGFGGPDTLKLRFSWSAARTRGALRRGEPDCVWPVPQALLNEPPPPGYHMARRSARPERKLLLVMRADLPPVSRLPARQALAHGINRDAILRELGVAGVEVRSWVEGGEPSRFPRLDRDQVRSWLDRGKLGRSFHVDMAYHTQGVGATMVRSLQEEWAELALFIEPRGLSARKLPAEFLGGRSHLVLVESQALTRNAVSELAMYVIPARGPAVGAFRTGWRTREFDPWIAPLHAPPRLPLDRVQRRLEEEMIVLPLARLPWLWLERDEGLPLAVHPHFGPELAPRPAPPKARP